jgi:hypothetical protein
MLGCAHCFCLPRDSMSPVSGGEYYTCALPHRAKPVKNTGWRLRQDGRRCFTVQQDVNRHCFTMRQDVDRRCVVMQQGVGRCCHNLIHQFLWLETSRHSTRRGLRRNPGKPGNPVSRRCHSLLH